MKLAKENSVKIVVFCDNCTQPKEINLPDKPAIEITNAEWAELYKEFKLVRMDMEL